MLPEGDHGNNLCFGVNYFSVSPAHELCDPGKVTEPL